MSDRKIREWLLSKPGLFEAATPAEVLKKAWEACGVECEIEVFQAALWRSGFTVNVVRGRYRLALPTNPNRGVDNTPALNHTTPHKPTATRPRGFVRAR